MFRLGYKIEIFWTECLGGLNRVAGAFLGARLISNAVQESIAPQEQLALADDDRGIEDAAVGFDGVVSNLLEVLTCGNHEDSVLTADKIDFSVSSCRRTVDRSWRWAEAFLINRVASFDIDTHGDAAFRFGRIQVAIVVNG